MNLTESAKVCAAQESCHDCLLIASGCFAKASGKDVTAAARLITAQAAVVEAGVCPECGWAHRGEGCANPYHDAREALDALGGSDE